MFTAPPIRSVLSFDGSSQYGDCGNFFNFTQSTPFSFSVWFRVNQDLAPFTTIISKMDDGGTFRGYLIGIGDSRKVSFTLRSSLSDVMAVACDTPVGLDWVNVTCTYRGFNSDTDLKVYINGDLGTQLSLENTFVSGGTTTTVPLQFARTGTTPGIDLFSGDIMQGGIWNKELTQDEVTRVVKSGRRNPMKIAVPSEFESGWMFTDRSKTVVPDYGKNGISCTLTGATYEEFDGREFDPKSIPGLTCWADASHKATLNGNNVSALADRSGNGNDLSAPATEPSYVASWRNGRPAIDCTSAWLRVAAYAGGAITQPLTIFSASEHSTTGDYIYGGGNSAGRAAAFRNTDTMSVYAGASRSTPATSNPPNGTPMISMARHLNGGTSYGEFYPHGFAKQTTQIGTTGSNSMDGLTMGNYYGASNLALDAPVAEILVYEGDLTDRQRANVLRYLSRKYNISLGTNAEALEFNASADYLITPDDASLQFAYADSLSFSAWVRWTGTVAGYITSKIAPIGYGGAGLFLDNGDIGVIRYGTPFGALFLRAESNTTLFNDGQWHHIVGTIQGSTDVTGLNLYVDGVQVAQTNTNNTPPSGANDTTGAGAGFQVNGRSGTATSSGSPFDICHAAMFGGELSAAEVASMYAQGIANPSYSAFDTRVHLTCTNTSETVTVLDVSGNGNERYRKWNSNICNTIKL